ncbi:MAG: hypothetical protein KME04_12030 [Pleurocapsa minor GSE-CHR-MK-17-07R]|nr:hypothetical protein [Pleurocapsa minor GSE-CHR-MK 17-07R]
MPVRQARLDDTIAISQLFRARIPVWQRLDTEGRVQTVTYEDLTVAERWGHGGHWMSVETSALYLNHLLLGAGIPLVSWDGATGQINGYAEAYASTEGDPVGSSLHVAHLVSADERIADALLGALYEQAMLRRLPRMTVTQPHDADLPEEVITETITSVSRYSISTREGQVFYSAKELPGADYAQISGWWMPVGRISSARYQWELLMPRQFETLPERASNPHDRVKLSAGGFEAIVYCEARPHDPRSADVSIWTPKGLQPQIVTAVRDWAAKRGYRTLWMVATEAASKAMGPDAEPDGYTLETRQIMAE